MKNQETKKNPILKMVKNSLLDLPSPKSISTLWNFGFMLGMTLTLQITTGLVLSMMYNANVEESFKNMVMIMRDNNMAWMMRNIHMNGASLFFMLMYIHLFRGIYFSSPSNQKKVWISGVIILIMTMATAFLGYVLPWGQMSFWGATVITGVLTAIPILGNDLAIWLWGGPAISQPTLNRFFSLHFMLPMLISVMSLMHLILLHQKGSSNPTQSATNMDKMKFHPMFSVKDSMTMLVTMLMLVTTLANFPNILGDVENFNMANPMVAPLHIQPEWYFLFAYVILRSIPSKLGGVIALLMSLLVLMVLVTKKEKSSKFNKTKKTKMWILLTTTIILTWIGTKTVESPYESIGQFYTSLYFLMIMMM